MEKMISALRDKRSQEIRHELEADKRERSIVISGLEEWGIDRPRLERQSHLEESVAGILDALKVDCLPEVTYRMGKFNDLRPLLVTVILPFKSHWSLALSNAHLLRRTKFGHIYVHRSMTLAERTREYELRQEARARNEGKPTREWVVYRGPNISDNELIGGLPHFAYRADRQLAKGGGVCCLVKDHFCVIPARVRTNVTADLLCLDIFSLSTTKSLRLVIVYRPPSSKAEDDKLTEVIFDLGSVASDA
ncbi:hypothetical protein ANCDUO_10255 [Ancylostoma duodenale]|uniref:Uncharacterized protein n=1 Tax=Ancylostoma duodenale TaxID=51022 RepID=A0A0C2DAW0_9BILA|nr:hypothetical protein ANCDUO_10255 [Ancylostoma duodenale]